MPEPKSPFKRVRRAFDQSDLKRVCEMHETDFPDAYNLAVTNIPRRFGGDDFYAYRDNGSSILAVAHLDTVVDHKQRSCNFLNTNGGLVVHSGALDDRLGAYTITELLPALGIQFDILLTTGEESGMSTAEDFKPPSDKEYDWIIEFDRGGTDVVMYQYEDTFSVDLVEEVKARVGDGSFSDISYLEHLGAKAFNWGVGYRDYHSVRGYAWLEDYWMMIGKFLDFHEIADGLHMPHTPKPKHVSKYANWWYDSIDDDLGATSAHGPDGQDDSIFDDEDDAAEDLARSIEAAAGLEGIDPELAKGLFSHDGTFIGDDPVRNDEGVIAL